MRFLFLLCGFWLMQLTHASAQESWKIYDTPWIAGDFKLMEVDELNQIYLLETSGRLIQYNSKGDSLTMYNDIKRFGIPDRLDVSNPMRPLLFFPAYSTMVILDRLLTYRGSLSFRKLQQTQTNLAVNAYDGNFWIYDEQEFKIKKINTDGKTLTESADLRLLLEDAPKPTALFESEQHVVLYDPTKGIFLFDLYGGYIKTWPYKNWRMVQGNKKNGISGFSEKGQWCTIPWEKPLPSCENLNLETGLFRSIRRIGNTFYLLNNQGLFRWQTK
jgi:hypothetical protein